MSFAAPTSSDKLSLSSQSVISVLDMYRLFGIDETVRETPFDFFAESRNPSPALTRPAAAPEKRIISETAGNSPAAAKAAPVPNPDTGIYTDAKSLEELKALILENGKTTKAAQSARHFIPFDGETSEPDIIIICDHPFADEEMSGTPGSGKERLFINSVLSAGGIGNRKICTYNICPWRPAGERSLTPDEIRIYTAPLSDALRIIKPRAVLSFSSVLSSEKTDFSSPENPGRPVFLCPSIGNMYKTPLLKQKAWSKIIELKQYIS